MKRALASAALLLALAAPAGAVSTVNPAVPAESSKLSSAVVRNNFAATYNDISNILGKYAGTVAPISQTPMQDWVDTSTSPLYKFRFWNPSTATWVQWGSLNINTGVFSVTATSGSLAANPPITLSFSGGVATYGLSADANFATTGGALALTSVAAGSVLANCTNASSEPTGCTWNAYANQAISATNGMIPSRVSGAWSTVTTGVSGHALPFLDAAALTFSGVLTSYAGTGTPQTALSGTLFRGVALDGAGARVEMDAYAQSGNYACVRADGTNAVPAALAANDQLCSLSASGYNGSGYGGNTAINLRLVAAQNWTPTANGTYFRIATTPNGTVAAADVLSVENDGGVTLGSLIGVANSKGAGTLNATGLYVNGVTVAAATTANNAVLVTNGSGVQSFSTTLPSGTAATSMALTTPSLGTATATTINGVGLAGTGTLTLNGAVRFGGATDFSATGGTAQYVKQTTSGGSLSVAAILPADLPLATNAAIGGMRGDGTTISCVAGVCQGIGASATSIAVGTTNVNTGTSGFVLTNNAGVLGNSAVGTLVTANASSKTDEQTGTSTSTIVTPSQQQQHDSAAKAWGSFTGSTGATLTSYNMSASRTSTGQFLITFSTAFASTNYSCHATALNTTTGEYVFANQAKTTTTINFATLTPGGTLTDPNNLDVVCYGRQ